jgi:hypothetical protein
MDFLNSIFGADVPKTATPVKETAKPATLTPVSPSSVNTPPVTLATPKAPTQEKPLPWNDPVWKRALDNQETGYNKSEEERNNAIGDLGRAVGKYQQWPINVETANMMEERSRRIVAQDWARENNKAIGGKEYMTYLSKLPAARKWTIADRKNPEKAEEIFQVIMTSLNKQFISKYKRPPTPVELARLHNAGSIEGFETSKRNPVYGVEFDKKYNDELKAEEAKNKK